MAYQIDPNNGDIVISGFEKGIADDPYSGLSDMRNIDIVSIPGEAPVGFATAADSLKVSSGTVASVTGSVLTYSGATEMPPGESGFCISFSSVASYSGVTIATPYWVSKQSNTSFKIYSDYEQTAPNQVTVTGSGDAPFTVYNVNFSNYQGTQPQKFTRSVTTGNSYMVDSIGQMWSDRLLTTSGYWKFMGNTGHTVADQSNGNGIVYYKPSGNTTGYIFVFSDSSIDYFHEQAPITWKYGWNPSNGSLNNTVGYLNAGSASGASHDSLVGQDNVVYYCDSTQVNSFREADGATFDPVTPATYVATSSALPALQLPRIDMATCLAELGVNLLVGGIRNFIYPWNRTATSFAYPILLAESVTQRMLTINTNAYVFTGNRGRIYITNGSQAQLWRKIPDHLSGTIEPYYRWGGVSSNKNQMYFSILATTNAGVALSKYGGIWAIDVDTLALRLVNQLSYGTYGGYVPALLATYPIPGSSSGSGNPVGYGIFAGWDSGSSTYGIDGTVATPYTGGQSYVISDMIPIGTSIQPTIPLQYEFKLSTPLLTGESVELQAGTNLTGSFVSLGITNGDSTKATLSSAILSDIYPNKIDPSQWLLIKCILTGIGSNPSYNRLVQIRVKGATVRGQAMTTYNQQ